MRLRRWPYTWLPVRRWLVWWPGCSAGDDAVPVPVMDDEDTAPLSVD